MKKIFPALMCAVLSAALLTGCGKDEKKSSESSKDKKESTSESRPGIPAVQARNRGNQAAYESGLKQLGLGIQMYATDNNDKMPGSLQDIAAYCSGIDFSPYVYIGNIGRMPSNSHTVPAAFLQPQFCNGDQLLLLMADGHIESRTIPALANKKYREIAESICQNISDRTLKNKLLENAAAFDR